MKEYTMKIKRESITSMEKVIADLYGINVNVYPMVHDNTNLCAFYNHIDKCICINTNYSFKDNEEIMNTLVHEGRHAWQDSEGLLDKCSIKHSSKGFDSYYYSSIEVDARWAVEQYKAGKLHKLREISFDLDTDINLGIA